MKFLKRVLEFVAAGLLFLLYVSVANIAFKLLTQPNDITVLFGLLILLAEVATLFYGVERLIKHFKYHGETVVSKLKKQKSKYWEPVILVLVAVGLSNCTRVGPGYVGVVVNMAGNDKGVQGVPTTTGWTFYNPLSTSVLEYPTFVQTAKWTKDVNEGHPTNEEITFTNKDSMLIAADISLSYHLEAAGVPEFYVKFRTDDIDQFTHGYLRNVARDAFNEAAGHYSIEQIMGDNGPFLNEVRTKLQKQIDPLHVVLDQFGFIGAPRPPQGVIDSINAKVQATQLALQKQNEIVQAEAEAKKQIAYADGQAKSRVELAQGEAQANDLLTKSLSQQVLEWQRLMNQKAAIDKWDGARPQVEGGSSGLLLQLEPRQKQQ